MMSFFEQISPLYVGGLILILIAAFAALRSFSLPRDFKKNEKIRDNLRLQRSLRRQDYFEDIVEDKEST